MSDKIMDKGISIPNNRRADFEIDPLFINRWSPRAYSSEPIDEKIIKTVFEAARWSMSCFNDQPWVIGYAFHEKDRELYLSLLAEGNRIWAEKAPVLGIIFARRRFRHNDKPNAWADFDCGAAWMALTMQARMYGLYTHGMAGFNEKETYRKLKISGDDYRAICAFTLGRYGDKDKLPDELRKREAPGERQSQLNFVFNGIFR